MAENSSSGNGVGAVIVIAIITAIAWPTLQNHQPQEHLKDSLPLPSFLPSNNEDLDQERDPYTQEGESETFYAATESGCNDLAKLFRQAGLRLWLGGTYKTTGDNYTPQGSVTDRNLLPYRCDFFGSDAGKGKDLLRQMRDYRYNNRDEFNYP